MTDDKVKNLGIKLASLCMCCSRVVETLHHLLIAGNLAAGI